MLVYKYRYIYIYSERSACFEVVMLFNCSRHVAGMFQELMFQELMFQEWLRNVPLKFQVRSRNVLGLRQTCSRSFQQGQRRQNSCFTVLNRKGGRQSAPWSTIGFEPQPAIIAANVTGECCTNSLDTS